MSTINRYFCETPYPVLMLEHPSGPWVRHDDHLAAVEAANAMRIELITQIDNLRDLADRYARFMHKRGDADERDYIQGGIDHAIKAVAPFKYNGAWQYLSITKPAKEAE